MLEHQVVVVSLVRELLDQGLTVRIGAENQARRAPRLRARARAVRGRRPGRRHRRRARPHPHGLPPRARRGVGRLPAARPASSSVIRDFYEVLGVARNATDDEIKRAYRDLARQLPPRRQPRRSRRPRSGSRRSASPTRCCATPSAGAATTCSATAAAAARGGPAPGGDAFGFGDLFDAFFGGDPFGMHGGRRPARSRGADAEAVIELTLVEAAFGVDAHASSPPPGRVHALRGLGLRAGHPPDAVRRLRRRGRGPPGPPVDPRPDRDRRRRAAICDGTGRRILTQCRDCRGDGRVHGAAHDRRRGARGRRRRPAAAARRARRRPRAAAARPATSTSRSASPQHADFERHGDDLLHVRRIGMTQAALGVPPRDRDARRSARSSSSLPGTQPGQLFRLKGAGVPALRGRGRGDLLVRVDVDVPTQLDDEESRAAAPAGRAAAAKRSRRREKGVFSRLRPRSSSERRRRGRLGRRGVARRRGARVRRRARRRACSSTGDDGHHLQRVRRLRTGETVTAADGVGAWRPYVVSAVEPRAGSALVSPRRRRCASSRSSSPGLAVAFALDARARSPRRSCTSSPSSASTASVPCGARRSVVRWDADRADAAVARLRRVAREAAMQCRRARAARWSTHPVDLAALAGHPGLVLGDPAGASPTAVAAARGGAAGSWSWAPRAASKPDEIEQLGRRLEHAVAVGPHVLRAETAAVAAGAPPSTVRRRRLTHADVTNGHSRAILVPRCLVRSAREFGWECREVTTIGAQVGDRLRAIRRQKGLSLHEVEARSGQEFKASVLGAYERGERALSVPRLVRLAEIYDVPPDQLLPRDDDVEIDLTDTRPASTTASRSTWCACTSSTIPTPRCSRATRRRSSSSARTSTAACSRSAATTSGCSPRCSVAAPTSSGPGSTSSASAPASEQTPSDAAGGPSPGTAPPSGEYASTLTWPRRRPPSSRCSCPGNHLMVDLLGQRDELLRLIEAAFPVTIHVRGNEITVTGDADDAERVGRLFEELVLLRRAGPRPRPRGRRPHASR